MKLKPCPFCAQEPETIRVAKYSKRHWIGCRNVECWFSPGSVRSTRAEAVRVWNDRPGRGRG